jgi:hypothetical protein
VNTQPTKGAQQLYLIVVLISKVLEVCVGAVRGVLVLDAFVGVGVRKTLFLGLVQVFWQLLQECIACGSTFVEHIHDPECEECVIVLWRSKNARVFKKAEQQRERARKTT